MNILVYYNNVNKIINKINNYYKNNHKITILNR